MLQCMYTQVSLQVVACLVAVPASWYNMLLLCTPADVAAAVQKTLLILLLARLISTTAGLQG